MAPVAPVSPGKPGKPESPVGPISPVGPWMKYVMLKAPSVRLSPDTVVMSNVRVYRLLFGTDTSVINAVDFSIPL